MIAAECDEVSLTRLLNSRQSPRYKPSVRRTTTPLKPKAGLSGSPGLKRVVISQANEVLFSLDQKESGFQTTIAFNDQGLLKVS